MQDLQQLEATLTQSFKDLKSKALNLDLTRGKPSAEQLDLSNALDGILAGDYNHNTIDTRNYGGIDGMDELKKLFADILQTSKESVIVGGNSSLSLMHQSLMFANYLGLFENQQPWSEQNQTSKFICPVPGYDRHFGVCESLNIEMINVDMNENGPDMDQVEALVKSDPSIKGMWNVPRFSNPTGITYSDDVVRRIANLSNISSQASNDNNNSDFIVLWDNAYALHSFDDNAPQLSSISRVANELGTYDHIIEFASTSKITFAGSGIAAMATGTKTLSRFKELIAFSTIGPDKINQLRHAKLFKDFQALEQHMQQHAAIIKPRFDMVLDALDNNLDSNMGSWTEPQGGYFVSFDTQANQAQEVIALCAEAGVKMTPAGATFPYGDDPQNCNIRIAPSFASLEDIKAAMDVFCVCVKLVNVRHQLAQ